MYNKNILLRRRIVATYKRVLNINEYKYIVPICRSFYGEEVARVTGEAVISKITDVVKKTVVDSGVDINTAKQEDYPKEISVEFDRSELDGLTIGFKTLIAGRPTADGEKPRQECSVSDITRIRVLSKTLGISRRIEDYLADVVKSAKVDEPVDDETVETPLDDEVKV